MASRVRPKVPVCLLVLVVASCAGEDPRRSEARGASPERAAATEQRSSRTVLGEALTAAASGWTPLTYGPLALQGGLTEIAFDLALPEEQPNPWWLGQVQAFVSSPSCGVYDAYMGAAELTGQPVGVPIRLAFAVPGYAAGNLQGKTCPDVTLTVVLNVPTSTAPGAYRVGQVLGRGPAEVPLAFLVSNSPGADTPAVVRSLSQDRIPLTVSPKDPGNPADVARAFFASYPQTFRLADPARELAVARVRQDEGAFAGVGLTHVRVRQLHRGLPVFQAGATVHLDGQLQVVSATGWTIPTPNMNTTPVLARKDALARAKTRIPAEEASSEMRAAMPTQVEIGIYAPSLFGAPGGPVLAYRVAVLGFLSFVDARSGAVLHFSDTVSRVLNRVTVESSTPSRPTLTEDADLSGGCPAGYQAETCAVHEAMGRAYAYFAQFGRDGWDNPQKSEMRANAFMKVDEPFDFGKHCAKSPAWESSYPITEIVHGKPVDGLRHAIYICQGAATVDIVAHEYSHAVFASEVGLGSALERRTLDEGFGDVWAVLIDGQNWLVGDGSSLGVMRDLAHPGVSNCADHYDERYTGAKDDGGVHRNSTILSHAAYLLAEGGEGHTVPVRGIGREKLGRLLYYALANAIGDGDDLYHAAVAIAQACVDVAGSPSPFVNLDDCAAVNAALTATGMLGTLELRPPTPGLVVFEGIAIEADRLQVTVTDRARNGPVPVRWSADGVWTRTPDSLALGAPFGPRELYATVTFDSGFSVTARADVTVVKRNGGSLLPVSVSAGAFHTCMLRSDGEVACWGQNDRGELGGSTSAPSNASPLLVPSLHGVQSLGAGGHHTCALTLDGAVRCWGANGRGELGPGCADGWCSQPVAVQDLTGPTEVAAGWSHTCAVVAGGQVVCWGSNLAGQLGGNCAATICASPVVVPALLGAKHVAAGNSHSCAVTGDDQVACWGSNSAGQLGTGCAGEECLAPATVPGTAGAVAVTAGEEYSCALMSDGTVRCWGANGSGQLGNGTFDDSASIVIPNVNGVDQLSASTYHTCVVRMGWPFCWGENGYGQLGNGEHGVSPNLTQVVGIVNVLALTTGQGHTCGLLDDGTIRCWGLNALGQLGDGSYNDSSVPAAIVLWPQ